MHLVKCGVHKMETLLGPFWGSNLNLSWGKCGIWLVDQWVPTSLCVFVCLIVDCTLRAFDIIILDACLAIVFVWGMGILIILIDPLAYPHILTLFSIWLLYSPWLVYSQCCLSLSSLYLDSFCYILSWSSWSMLSLLYIHLYYHTSCLAVCRFGWYIHVFCMTVCCMTTLLLCDACVACLCGTHTYPLVSKSLVLLDFVFLDLVFDTRLVALFVLRPS